MAPRRKDALENRDRIIASARELFAKGTTDVSMDSVRRHAGVGRATFYRNFDDLDSLSAAIFEENVRSLEAAISADDSAGSFERVLITTIDEGMKFRSLFPVLATRGGTKEIRALSSRVNRLLGRSLKRAQARGEVRAELVPADLLLILAMVFSTVLAVPGSKNVTATARRALRFVLDGIRVR